MNRRGWWVLGVASGLSFVWALIAFWPTAAPPPAPPVSSQTAAFGAYKPIPDLCSAVDYEGDPVPGHTAKANYLLYTCDRGEVSVSALFFTSASDAALHFQGVQANVTGAKPVANLGAEAFSAGNSVWVYDANLVLMVRVRPGGPPDVASDTASEVARKSLPRLRA